MLKCLHRYKVMDYRGLIGAVDNFFRTAVEGFERKLTVANGLQYVYVVNGSALAVTFWWKTAYVVITNKDTEEVLYSIHDPQTEWVVDSLKHYYGL